MRDVDAIAAAVRPELEALEQLRLELKARQLRAWKTIVLVCGALIVVGLLVAWIVGGGAVQPIVMAVAGGITAIVFIVMVVVTVVKPGGELKETFKRRAVSSIVRAMEPEMTFSPEVGISRDDFERSRLFGTEPDRYNCEDGLRGKIGRTSVHISEVHAEERRRRTTSKGHTQTYYVTIFKGVFMLADFHKNFRCTTRVLPDTAESLLGGLGKMLQGFKPFSKEELIYLEDPEFEKEFVVYGTDQVEARYILSTSMLRRILELKREWKNEVRLSFIDNLVFVAIAHKRDLFEPDLGRSALSRETVRRIVRDLALCFDLVDDLKLNTRIWSKS